MNDINDTDYNLDDIDNPIEYRDFWDQHFITNPIYSCNLQLRDDNGIYLRDDNRIYYSDIEPYLDKTYSSKPRFPRSIEGEDITAAEIERLMDK